MDPIQQLLAKQAMEESVAAEVAYTDVPFMHMSMTTGLVGMACPLCHKLACLVPPERKQTLLVTPAPPGHNHSPNIVRFHWMCRGGHKISYRSSDPCPAEGCGYRAQCEGWIEHPFLTGDYLGCAVDGKMLVKAPVKPGAKDGTV